MASVCPICNVVVPDLETHLPAHFPGGDTPPRRAVDTVCPVCQEEFATAAELDVHIPTHFPEEPAHPALPAPLGGTSKWRTEEQTTFGKGKEPESKRQRLDEPAADQRRNRMFAKLCTFGVIDRRYATMTAGDLDALLLLLFEGVTKRDMSQMRAKGEAGETVWGLVTRVARAISIHGTKGAAAAAAGPGSLTSAAQAASSSSTAAAMATVGGGASETPLVAMAAVGDGGLFAAAGQLRTKHYNSVEDIPLTVGATRVTTGMAYLAFCLHRYLAAWIKSSLFQLRNQLALNVGDEETVACVICSEDVGKYTLAVCCSEDARRLDRGDDADPVQAAACVTCFGQYIGTTRRGNDLANVPCIMDSCRGVYSDETVRHFLDPLVALRLADDLSEAVLAGLGDRGFLCGACGALGALPEDGKAGEPVFCVQCGAVSCARCGFQHRGTLCPDSGGLSEADKAAVRTGTKPCPKCGTAIHRTTGCDHVGCVMCQTKFCYACGGKQHQYYGCPGAWGWVEWDRKKQAGSAGPAGPA